MQDKLFILKLRQGQKIPHEAKIIQTDVIDEDESGRYVLTTLLLPLKETAESLLSRARSCYIQVNFGEEIIIPVLLERAVLKGQMLHELSNTGRILTSYNTHSERFLSISWVDEASLGLEGFAVSLLEKSRQGVNQ